MINQYQPNLETIQNYLADEAAKSSGDGINWWSIPTGTSVIRILPPWDPTGRVALPVYSHAIEFKGKNMNFTKYTWTCTNKTFGKPCPICDGLATLASMIDVSKYEPNSRKFYFNAIIINDPSYNPAKKEGYAPGSHVLMKAPKTFYDWVISQITNPMVGDITNVESGIDIMVTKSGSGLETSYNMTLSPNGRTPVPQEYLDKITDLYNLGDIFSAGFEQDIVTELIESLSHSGATMGAFVNNTVAQMQQPSYPNVNATFPQGGINYQQPVYAAPQQLTPPWNVSPVQQAVPQMQMAPVTPVQPVSAPIPQAPQNPAVNPVQTPADASKPRCYGQYNPGNVNCVVCPEEVNCSKMKA